MTGNYNWILRTLDDDEYRFVEGNYDFEKRYDLLSAPLQGALQIFRDSPQSMVPKWVPRAELPEAYRLREGSSGIIDASPLREYNDLFSLPQYKSLYSDRFSFNERTVLKVISGENAPAGSLMYALGAERAERLPGFLGNILIDRNSIEQAIEGLAHTLGGIDSDSWDRARRTYSWCTAGQPSKRDDGSILEIFTALPAALNMARDRKANFLAFCFWRG